MELAFDEAAHVYTVDGRPVPCVSDIVAVYGAEITDELEQELEAAAERGTVCHALLERYVQGEYDAEFPDAYEAYVEGIRLFLAEHTISPIAAETPMYSERLGIAGTPDLLCEFDGVQALLDYKFVAQRAKTKVKAQLNAYREIYADNGVFVDALYAVQFLPGTYRLYPVKADAEEFEAALAVYRLKKRKHPRGMIG